jgi:hypothetical protein
LAITQQKEKEGRKEDWISRRSDTTRVYYIYHQPFHSTFSNEEEGYSLSKGRGAGAPSPPF